MEAYGRRRQPENRKALLVPALLWGALVAPPLIVLVAIAWSGQIGLLVMAFFLALPASAGLVRLIPYFKDLGARPVAVQGGVIEKRSEDRYFVFRGRSVLLDSDYANLAAHTAGAAAHVSGGGLPVMERVNMGRGAAIVTLGGSPTESLGRLAAREAREEMEVSRYSLSRGAFAKIGDKDRVRVWYYPNSHTTAAVERWDDRLQRFVPV